MKDTREIWLKLMILILFCFVYFNHIIYVENFQRYLKPILLVIFEIDTK